MGCMVITVAIRNGRAMAIRMLAVGMAKGGSRCIIGVAISLSSRSAVITADMVVQLAVRDLNDSPLKNMAIVRPFSNWS